MNGSVHRAGLLAIDEITIEPFKVRPAKSSFGGLGSVKMHGTRDEARFNSETFSRGSRECRC